VRVVFAPTLGYPTPKVDVRAVVFRGEELLFVRERKSGGWTFPGGWADVGDTPGQAAERETLEESGYRVEAVKVVALLDKTRHEHPVSIDYTYKVLIGCRLLDGVPVTSHEIDAVAFFPRGELPELDLDRTTPSQVARWRGSTTTTRSGRRTSTDVRGRPTATDLCNGSATRGVSVSSGRVACPFGRHRPHPLWERRVIDHVEPRVIDRG
jgi:ADP-ribose pyrophosphatase YjhB (NUDIX family)